MTKKSKTGRWVGGWVKEVKGIKSALILGSSE